MNQFHSMNTSEQILWLNAECPDGGFLQSEAWRGFEEREGHSTFHFENQGLWANVIEYRLPVVGKYWYVPRGPILDQKSNIKNQKRGTEWWQNVIEEARERGVGWVRVEPRGEEALTLLREWSRPYGMKKALHDMQPREILVMDISKSEDEILAGMKTKTRYNVRLAEKRGVEVSSERSEVAVQEFLKMIRETARRNDIAAHPEERYRNFFEAFSEEMLELLVARRDGTTLAAILVSFFGDTATYLHGASSDDDRGSMAPFLLQLRAIQRAKRRGCARYDLGGVDTIGERPSLAGVTRFKRGFAENVKTVRFPGSSDIILLPSRFSLYEIFGMSKMFVKKAVRLLTKR